MTERALLPLVHDTPGPLDTDDERVWVRASSAAILRLKVADIAMGSGAFLVAACRFLGDRLVRAWADEGDPAAQDHLDRSAAEGEVLRVDGAVAPVVTRARRMVIQHCLYGVDINPMAVEMAKLSLWLVSMAPGRPFTFLDDRLVAGDSLLGLAGLDQLEALHMVPRTGRRIHGKWVKDPTAGVRTLLVDLAGERQGLAELPGDDLGQLGTKRERLASVDRLRWRVDLLADLVVSSALSQAGLGERGLKLASKNLGGLAEDLVGQPPDSDEVQSAEALAAAWLALDLPPYAEDRSPVHWPLIFPEVFGDHGGFDAIIGNPPFLGGKKITGALGTAYRNYLLHGIGHSVRGNADLVAYFLLRAHELLNGRGQAGLIATNTLAQGDTREVGLDQLTAAGVTIKAAIKSEPWPSKGAVLEFCAVWTSKPEVAAGVDRILDHQPVRSITPTLEAGSRVSGQPHRLADNSGIAFIGSYVLGMGFTLEPERARQLIEADPRNAEVLFPYLNGEDLNTRPDGSARRWVINFHDWSEERAASHPAPFAQVTRDGKPERDQKSDRGYREKWWRFGRSAIALYPLLEGKQNAIAITLVSKVVMPVMVPTGQVFAHRLAVFVSDDFALLGVLASSPHYWWAIGRSSTLESRTNYTPTDAFETFTLPQPTTELRHLGDRLDRERRELMLARQAGLTATYNLVHDPACTDPDIVGLRHLHRDLDHAVFAAYGWTDLAPVHDHLETRQGIRWTIDPATRQEMLDRLLQLNHDRHTAEQGLPTTTDSGGTLF